MEAGSRAPGVEDGDEACMGSSTHDHLELYWPLQLAAEIADRRPISHLAKEEAKEGNQWKQMLGVSIVVELCEGCQSAETISGMLSGVLNLIILH